jgi:hypothetical protein
MIWTLFVISFIPEFNEVKYTRYKEFATEQACLDALQDMQSTFKNNESVDCSNE